MYGARLSSQSNKINIKNLNKKDSQQNIPMLLEDKASIQINQTLKEQELDQNPQKEILATNNEYVEPSLKQSNIRSVYSANQPPESLLNFFKSFEPTAVEGISYVDITKLHKSLHLKLKKYKESVYYGDFINGKRHGQGIMIYNNQRIYEGEWSTDYKHGKGLEKFTNGCQYVGTYVNGKPQGIGRYSWPNGEFYEGEWLNGMKHGTGMWKGAKGDSYVGEWKFNKADGYGVHVWLNGDRYEGEFHQSLKHGEGTEKFVNGDIYKGRYQNGKPCGFGEYYWANGSYFKGVFENGFRNGQGLWKKSTGNSDRYEGEYRDDKKHGYGIFSWASGNVYKGNYEFDTRNGFGEMYWTDGSYYKGEWQSGIQHGMGEIYIPGEGVKKGVFQNNTLIHIDQDQQTPSAQNSRYDRISQPIKKPLNKRLTQNKEKSYHPSQTENRSFRSRAHSSIKSTHSHSRNQDSRSIDEAKVFRMTTNEKGLSQLNPLINPKPRKGKEAKVGQYGSHDQKKSNTLDAKKDHRIMHSAFYMHKIHNNKGETNSVTAENDRRRNLYTSNAVVRGAPRKQSFYGLQSASNSRVSHYRDLKQFARSKLAQN